MSNSMYKYWGRPPITFECVILPWEVIGIDHLGMYDNLPGLSEEASHWLWRFPICVGRYQEDESSAIIRVIDEVLPRVLEEQESLLRTVPKKYGWGTFDQDVLDQCVSALKTMQEIAAQKPRCRWSSIEE